MTWRQRTWLWLLKVTGIGPTIGLLVQVRVQHELAQQVPMVKPAPDHTGKLSDDEAKFLAHVDAFKTPDGQLFTVFGMQSIRTQ